MFRQECAYAIRTLRKHAWLTFAAMLSLALGIGATTTVFSVVYSVLLRPLPYADPDRVLFAGESQTPNGPFVGLAAPGNVRDWAQQNHVFEQVALCSASQSVTLAGDPVPERIQSQYATAELFPLLGVGPLFGRSFTPDDPPSAIIISHKFWQSHFSSDPSAVGKPLRINNAVFTVIGIMPRGFQIANFVTDTDIWRPVSFKDPAMSNRRLRWLLPVVRLKKGVTRKQAEAEMSSIARGMESTYPDSNKGWGVQLRPIRETMAGNIKSILYPFFGAVAFLLLIACANVSNLMLVRARARQGEVCLRLALGSSRWQLCRQLMIESLVFIIPAALMGLALASVGVSLYVAFAPATLPSVTEASVNVPVLAFLILISILTVFVVGLAPMIESFRVDVNSVLRVAAKGTHNRSSLRVINGLVLVEIALAIVLLTGAGLMINTFLRLNAVQLGFDPRQVLTMELELSGPRYVRFAPQRGDQDMRDIDPAVETFYRNLLDRVGALPTIKSAALASWAPFGSFGPGRRDRSFTITGRPATGTPTPTAAYSAISAEYFRTLNIPLREGRTLDARDTLEKPWVVVINESLARQYWPNRSPIGEVVTLDTVEEERPREIVGVVGDYRQASLSGAPIPEMYVPFEQQPRIYPGHGAQNRLRVTLLLRAASQSPTMSTDVRKAIAELDRNQPVYSVRSMDDLISRSITPTRFYTLLLAIFAGTALILATVGIYGVMAFAVYNWLREIGIRMVSGAGPADIGRLIMVRAAKLVSVGMLAGFLMSVALTRMIASLLYRVQPLDVLTFVAVGFVMSSFAVLAAFAPVNRAIRTDPNTVLRYE